CIIGTKMPAIQWQAVIRQWSVVAALFIVLCGGPTMGHNIEHMPNWLLLISMDGFRHDYIHLAAKSGYNVSAFRRLQQEGISGRTVIDDFVSKTFPNHYTIATGLHEERHGVLSNKFYDPELQRGFDASTSTETAMWNNGSRDASGPEPIWVTAQRHKLHSAVLNWPSSAAKIKSAYPTYSLGLYSHQNAMQADYYIERIANWFETDEHCRLSLLYLPEPDSTGHKFGPDSPKILEMVQTLNDHLSRLLDRFESSKKLKGKVNIILTSDHGMTKLDKSKVIFMDTIVNRSLYNAELSHDYTAWHVWPAAGKEQIVFDKLKAASANQPFTVLRKGDPWLIRSHYNYNRRIAPIFLVAKLHSAIVYNNTCDEYKVLTSGERLGDHGYNNSDPDMHPIFAAWGPAFLANRTVSQVRLVDIYPLCCELLGLHASEHDAGPKLAEPIRAILRDDDDDDEAGKSFYLSSTLVTTFVSFLLVACLTSVFALGAMRAYRTSLYRRNRRFGLLDDTTNSSGGRGGGGGFNHHDRLPLSLDDEDF
ncbi:hypothetical protein BOX15_Mlig009789g1, partial [Macrostomum lignano]